MGFISPPPFTTEPRAGRILPCHISTWLPGPNTLLLMGTPDFREPARGRGAQGPHHGPTLSSWQGLQPLGSAPSPHRAGPQISPFPSALGSSHRPRTARWEGWIWGALGILAPSWPGPGPRARGVSRGALPAGARLPRSPSPATQPGKRAWAQEPGVPSPIPFPAPGNSHKNAQRG